MGKGDKYPNCTKCHAVIDVWANELVTDAYQKDGVNHYTFFCPHCGSEQNMDMPIDNEGGYTPEFRGFLPEFFKAMFSKNPPVAQ